MTMIECPRNIRVPKKSTCQDIRWGPRNAMRSVITFNDMPGDTPNEPIHERTNEVHISFLTMLEANRGRWTEFTGCTSSCLTNEE